MDCLLDNAENLGQICSPCSVPECRGCAWCPACKKRASEGATLQCGASFPRTIEQQAYNHTYFCEPCHVPDFEECEECVLCAHQTTAKAGVPISTRGALISIAVICSLFFLVIWAYWIKPHIPHGYKSLA
ncbi:hypothetical protein Pelo_16050 [Pelomyxa schiedti]|nr:hypothetical protein Pelo_16050 [Pelomyxa schiedti]